MADGIDNLIANPSAQRRTAATDLIVLVTAAVVLISLIGPGRRVIGGPMALKLLFLGRMGVLLIIATWLLHRQHRTWRDIGLRAPDWWRLIAAVPAGLIVISGAVAAAKAVVIQPATMHGKAKPGQRGLRETGHALLSYPLIFSLSYFSLLFFSLIFSLSPSHYVAKKSKFIETRPGDVTPDLAWRLMGHGRWRPGRVREHAAKRRIIQA